MSEDAGASQGDQGTGTGTGNGQQDSAPASGSTANGSAQQGSPQPSRAASGNQGARPAAPGASDDDSAAELLAGMAAQPDSDGDTQERGGQSELQSQVDHWKQMARKNEQRARQNAAAAKELDDIKRSQMSDQERLQAERDQYRQEAADKAAQLNRVMAAAAYDLPPSLIDHLGGGTEEEINGRAEAFAAAINERVAEEVTRLAGQSAGQEPPPAAVPQPVNPLFRGRVPLESMRPGAAPAGDNVARDRNQLFRQMLSRS